MKIQHIKLDMFKHILVVDGVRGPLCTTAPTTHPSGVVAYPEGIYGVPPALAGKVFVLCPREVEQIDDSACDESTKAFKEWSEIQKTCVEIKLARYGAEGEAK